jgi:hypothetical protein
MDDRRKGEYKMTESLGITVQNTCYECMVIERDKQDGFTVGKCQTCLDTDEARADDQAHNLHEEDRLHEPGKVMSYDTSDEPSASDWISSQTYVRPRGWIVKFTEKWDEDNPFKLIELSVKFLKHDEPLVRNEFLPPIAQLIDGGVHEELWELDDMRQRMKEVQCHWCNLLTPRIFNDCQACDKPLEQNVR